MGESAAFVYDPKAMEALKQDIQTIKEEAQTKLEEAQKAVEAAQEALAVAQEDYAKALADYEDAKAQYSKDIANYNKAKERGDDPGSPPTPPTPPDKSAVTAAEQALAEAEKTVAAVHKDIECLNALIASLIAIATAVKSSEEEAVHILTQDFFQLYKFSGMTGIGNDVADAITDNANAVQDGYDYVKDKNGNKIYLDLFADEKDLTMAQYQALGAQIGSRALIQLMRQHGRPVEMVFAAAYAIGSALTQDEIREIYNNPNIHTDNSSEAKLSKVLSAVDSDTNLYIDGVEQELYRRPIADGVGYVSSPYGATDCDSHSNGHGGIDIAAPYGTTISAAVAGVVVEVAYEENGYGNYVVVKGNDGNYYYYAHMSSTSVNEGDTVGCGDELGAVGSTGDSTGNHLHFEVREGSNNRNARCDPRKYVDI